jgi:NADPH:quinone reductase-like Zn-dependent oxidoreductase
MGAYDVTRTGPRAEPAIRVMRAIVRDHYGPPESLELRELDVPTPGAGEVLVRVRAASVNFADPLVVRGRPLVVRLATGFRRPRNPVPGVDLAGEVEAIGSGVTRFRPGDPVFGRADGAFAEFAVASQDRLAQKPAILSFDEAAAVPMAGTTALQGIRDHGGVQPGQRVLVIGASGGVGTFAVQIARALGAHVTGVCSTRNLDLVRSIGAEAVIDYARDDYLRGTTRFEVILQVAGTHSPLELRRILSPGGTLVLSSGQGRLAGVDRILKALATSAFVRERLVVFAEKENQEDLLALVQLAESGSLAPVVDRTYSLHDGIAAIRYMEAGHTRGKVVITP